MLNVAFGNSPLQTVNTLCMCVFVYVYVSSSCSLVVAEAHVCALIIDVGPCVAVLAARKCLCVLFSHDFVHF